MYPKSLEVAQTTSKLEVGKVSLFYGQNLRAGSSAVLWPRGLYDTFLESTNLHLFELEMLK